MLERLLPSFTDFRYTGSRVSLWLLGLVLLLKIAISLGSIFNGYYAASVADGIPLDSYSPQAAQAVISLFAFLGLSHLILGLLGVLVLVRYRPLVPLFLLVLLVEYLARKGVSISFPIARSGNAPGSAINWAIFGVMLVAFILSMRQSNMPNPPLQT